MLRTAHTLRQIRHHTQFSHVPEKPLWIINLLNLVTLFHLFVPNLARMNSVFQLRLRPIIARLSDCLSAWVRKRRLEAGDIF
jgi:hypothetical protein